MYDSNGTKPLEELKKQTGGEEAWMEALPSLRELGEVLTAKDGPFCMGDTRTSLPTPLSSAADPK